MMNLEIGHDYVCRNGRRAKIIEIAGNEKTGLSMFRALIFNDRKKQWQTHEYFPGGFVHVDKHEHAYDIIMRYPVMDVVPPRLREGALRAAWKRFCDAQPKKGESCCFQGRHESFQSSARDDMPFYTIEPDEQVCERERAWRQYVRIRDNNPYYAIMEL